MGILTVSIELLSPTLLAATPPASNLSETLIFIPGNTVRGLLARRYLDCNGNTVDDLFRNLFINGRVKYGFGLLDGAAVLPLSARSCKYDGGFKNDGGHGIVDLLLQSDNPLQCGCDAPIDYFKGFWWPDRYQQSQINTRLITRTAIDPGRATARTGQLYSQRVLEEGQIFTAWIEVPDELQQELAALLVKSFSARIGTGTSRGQGWVKVCAGSTPPMPWRKANERYKEYKEKYKQPREDASVLTVTLLSDGLFQDDYLRDLTAPKIQHLKALGIAPEHWEEAPARAFMDTRVVFGFDGFPVNLPRQQRLAVAAGSVFLFKSLHDNPQIPNGDGVGWIGDCNSEGYGHAVLWHPFHLVPDQSITVTQDTLTTVSSQEGQIILQARTLFKQDFHQISKAQMAAVENCFRRTQTYPEAVTAAVDYLEKQLQKLSKKIERGAIPSSWALPTKDDKQIMLGTLLIQWIKEQEYLQPPLTDDQEKLAALRLFWDRFHGFYRFKSQTGDDMKLKFAGE